jgi:hypothetical protein
MLDQSQPNRTLRMCNTTYLSIRDVEPDGGTTGDTAAGS